MLLCLQDTKDPNLLVPIPVIKEPLPPKKSSCAEASPAPVPTMLSTANEALSPVVFPLFFGMMWAVICISNQ